MKRQEMMIIIGRNGRTLHMCSCYKLSEPKEEISIEPIPEYYSDKHAYDNGWRCTDDIKFCPPGEDFQWVCPRCARIGGLTRA